MPRFAPRQLQDYLFGKSITARGCLRIRARSFASTRRSQQETPIKSANPSMTIPFRKQLKDAAKARKTTDSSSENFKKPSLEHHPEWELTIGIEIHAQLNTPRKLFSSAASTINAAPNTHVALFDLAVPGTQPIFQPEVLIPAIRAALALNCNIETTSKFDRKHYFHWDQPAGYQITQFYEPLARNGYIHLYRHDGIAEEDLVEEEDFIRIGIKQVQMEQDTAKTIAQPDGTHLLDFNRVGLPLVEIITMPEIHSPSTAAALMRKVQSLLSSVDACVLGMESGGLRADVNVSVRRRGELGDGHAYAGVEGLGTRTEIKNLSSFKAVKDAIIAERDRQIGVLEGGGVIEGETRGWTIGSSETRRLRGKEGEVDYRYMPDPDVPPITIAPDLIERLKSTMGVLPDAEIESLTTTYGLTTKDAMSLVALDDGGRAEYFYNVVDCLQEDEGTDLSELGRTAGNWVLHELGGVIADSEDANVLQLDVGGNCVIPAAKMAAIIRYLMQNRITGKTAKQLLSSLLHDSIYGSAKTVDEMIEEGGLWFTPLSPEEYKTLAETIMSDHQKEVGQILKGQKGKIMFLVGQMMRVGEKGRVEAKVAEAVLREALEGRGRVGDE